MAVHTPVNDGPAPRAAVRTEDLVPVQSRISWGAIAAGSVLALALYFLLTLLGGALGLTISDRTSAETLGTAAAVWAIVVTAVCLFAGGYIASQMTTGENKAEGTLYGFLVWAMVFAMLLWLMATGVRAGFNAMVGVATSGAATTDATAQGDWAAAARRAGVPQDRIEEFRKSVQPTPGAAVANDPAVRQEAADAATRVTWYTFLGTLVSMLAAAAGGFVGAGPTLRLFAIPLVGGGPDRREALARA